MRVVIVGTGTDVGKTHVTCALAAAARARGSSVRAYKPVATGVDDLADDAAAHAKACGAPYLAPTFVYRRPVSPHLAAREEGRPIELAPIVEAVASLETSLPAPPLVLVETAGGLFSPLDDARTNADLARALAPAALVLVASDRLGVLHDVRATTLAATAVGLSIARIVLSAPPSPDASTGDNARELARLGFDVVATFPRAPFDAQPSLEAGARLLAALA